MEQIIIETYNANVSKSDKNWLCWNWIGTKSKYGGPIFKLGTKNNEKEYSARRISLLITGKILSPRERVFYICKNKLCVNPEHLTFGNEGRFNAKIQKLNEKNGGCWIWTSAEDKNGYGKFCYYDKDNQTYHDVRAHRYSWELRNGPISSSIILVCHKCDNPRCVNPDHLFLGDAEENMHDRDQKGRSSHGDKHYRAILKSNDIPVIRDMIKNQIPLITITKTYGVSKSTITSIKYRQSWTSVPDQ